MALNAGSLSFANNQFSLDLYKTLIAPQPNQKNAIISPFSIFSAFAMLDVGARGSTRDEILNALKLKGAATRNEDLINTGFKDLFSSLSIQTQPANNSKTLLPKTTSRPSGHNPHVHFSGPPQMFGGVSGPSPTTLSLANRVYIQTGFPLNPKFQSTERSFYSTDLGQVDFKEKTVEAKNEINQWVEGVTNGKIKNLFTTEITKSTKLVLVSALYLKADWEEKFKEDNTRDADFFLANGNSVKVKTMGEVAEFGNYAEFPAQDATGYLKAYAKSTLHMIFILPNKKDGLLALERSLSLDFFNISRYETFEVDVSIPKFKIEDKYKLVDGMKSLGVNTAFTPNANFSGISGAMNLMVGDAVHKVFIEVDETGTEAAAATAVEMLAGAVFRPESMKRVFKADHPFLFAIQHRDTGAVLFLGRVESPTI